MPFAPNTPKEAINSIKIITYVKLELEEKQGLFYWEKKICLPAHS